MTKNDYPESILIGESTIRNLNCGLSVRPTQGFRRLGMRKPTAPNTNRAAEWTFRCLKICIGMFEVGHPWCKSRKVIF